jgi:hypothetical protein
VNEFVDDVPAQLTRCDEVRPVTIDTATAEINGPEVEMDDGAFAQPCPDTDDVVRALALTRLPVVGGALAFLREVW